MKRRILLKSLILTPFTPAGAQLVPDVLSGDRFMVGKEEFQLADVIAPPYYHFGNSAPPFFEFSRKALEALMPSFSAEAVEDVLALTKWNVRRVRWRLSEGETAQEILVRAGAVRVKPMTDDIAFIKRLIALEEDARLSGTGLWSASSYKVLSSQSAFGGIGKYSLIEGVVRQARSAGSRFYLNFGDDYRTDFTASTAKRLAGKWEKSGLQALSTMEGQQILVRGMVDRINGPSIDLVHPLQITPR